MQLLMTCRQYHVTYSVLKSIIFDYTQLSRTKLTFEAGSNNGS